MLDLLKQSPVFMQMAIEAMNFAKNKKTLGDYKRYCLTQKRTLEGTFDNRMRVMEFLLNTNFIQKNEIRLFTNSKLEPWIKDELMEGDTTIWKLVNAIDEEKNIIKKFDNQKLKTIGLEGEQFVISQLKEKIVCDIHGRINHVSLTNDTLGYDILAPSINLNNNNVKLEVKTSVQQGRNFTFFISRNEYEKGVNDPGWFLVFVKKINGNYSLLGHARTTIFSEFLPEEVDDNVRWQSLNITIDPNATNQGLP